MDKNKERDLLNGIEQEEYKEGFVTDIEQQFVPKGLNEEIIRLISRLKEEPDWLLDFRLDAFRRWQKMTPPSWGHLDLPPIDFQDIIYYAAPKKDSERPKEIDPKLEETFEKLGIPIREREALAGVVAVDAVFDSVSVTTTFRKTLEDMGIIFCSFSEAVKNHPDLVRIYPVLVIAGTPLAELWHQGRYRALTVEEAVAACWPLYRTFTGAGIRVIRMGLQPDRELCAPGHILAGPFHPAFGEKVKSWGIGQQVLQKIAEQPRGNYNMVITCPDRMASLVRGQHRSNVRLWEQTGKVRVFFQTGETFEVIFHDRKTL